MVKVLRRMRIMKCKYDEYFIQKYNDGLLCMEDKTEFENHLENCKLCKDLIRKDKIFLDFVREETEIKEIPIENILSRIDANKYKQRHRLIPGFYMKPLLKGFVPALGVVLIIAMMSFSNPFSETVKSAVGNVLNKSERVNIPSALSEIKLEEFDNKTTEITGQKLVEELNKDGLGVAPWTVSYGSSEKIFFKSYAALVGYKNGAIYKVADLKNMQADHVQGSVVSDFRFNSKGDYVVIGNRLDESEGYQLESNIYMLETDTGKYHIIEKGNLKSIVDNWSFNGQFYVYANKNTNSNIKLFNSSSKKFYEIENTAFNIEKIFVSDEGEVSFYADGNICFLKKDTYEIGTKISVDFTPLFINSKDNFSVALKDGVLKKYQFDKYGDYSFKKSSGKAGEFHGYTYSYVREGEKFKLVGSLTERNGFTIIEQYVKDDKIVINKECSGLTIKDKYIPFELVWVEGCEDYVFDTYFDLMQINKPQCKPMTGWTSWYNYYQNINESIILENLNNFKGFNKNIDIFQIDDGFRLQ
jgi:hypothetical protein